MVQAPIKYCYGIIAVADKLSKEKRSWNMSRVRGKNTAPELLVRSLLHDMGFRFRLHRKDLPGSPDIILPKYKTVIFVHGCYWHRHPGCKFSSTPHTNRDFWIKKFSETVRRDRENSIKLEESGWNVLVIWQCETKNTEKISGKLNDFFQESELTEQPD